MALKKAFIFVPLRTSFDERKIAEAYQGGCAVAHKEKPDHPWPGYFQTF
jgi:hypothetical protein